MFIIPIITIQPVIAETQFMSPQLAFKPIVNTGSITIKIATGYYLYQKRLQVFDANTNKPLKFTILTKPITKNFPSVPQAQILFVDEVNIKVSASPKTNIILGYQGCSTHGICYPPQHQELTIK